MPAKPHAFQTAPKTPNFDREAQATLQHDGLPPLAPARVEADAVVVFANVSSVWVRAGAGVEETLGAASGGEWGVVVTRRGRVLCAGADRACAHHMSVAPAPVVVDLAGGAITPGLVSFGTSLGLQEIAMEGTTTDGDAPDPLTNKIPGVLGGDGALMRAADGLQLGSRDMLWVPARFVLGLIFNLCSRIWQAGVSWGCYICGHRAHTTRFPWGPQRCVLYGCGAPAGGWRGGAGRRGAARRCRTQHRCERQHADRRAAQAAAGARDGGVRALVRKGYGGERILRQVLLIDLVYSLIHKTCAGCDSTRHRRA